MRPFIQAKGDMPETLTSPQPTGASAEMGFECVLFRSIEELDASSRGDVVVGGLGPVRHALVSRGVRIEEFDYPDDFRGYMGKGEHGLPPWTKWLPTARCEVFVKPVEDKRFTGKTGVHRGFDGVGNLRIQSAPCSEVVDFRAEWRCFVRYGGILDVRLQRRLEVELRPCGDRGRGGGV